MPDLNQLDKSNFRQFILDTPNQFKVGIDLAKNIKLESNFTSLAVSGMGGSALPIDLFKVFSQSLPKNEQSEIILNRYYKLPERAKKDDVLNIISSYSGNTEETISSLEELEKLGKSYIGLSSGGKIEELCKNYGKPHVKLPIPYPNYQPRMGTGYFFGAIYQILVNHGLISDNSSEIISEANNFHNFMEKYEQKGKELAGKLNGKTPVIYTSSPFRFVAMVWKIKMNENAKTPAFWNYFPELNHNEMVGFTNPQAKFFLLMLKDPDDDPRNLKRYEATKKLLSEKGVDSEIVNMDGKSVFSKIFLSITLADWTSYYLALEYGQDPTPVDMVEKLKHILAS